MATLRLFASIREAAGTRTAEVHAATVAEAMTAANERFGPGFAELAGLCRVWVNGEPAEPATPVGPDDEIALLPPVSGG